MNFRKLFLLSSVLALSVSSNALACGDGAKECKPESGMKCGCHEAAAHGEAHKDAPKDAPKEAHEKHHNKEMPKDAHKEAPAHAGAHWGYDGEEAPSHWASLDKEYTVCDTGKAESPVNIAQFAKGDLPDIQFAYQDLPLSLTNNGHTLMVKAPAGSKITVEGHEYELQQIHFHTPSEHYMNGSPYPMEAHFVHKDAKGHLAVIGVMMKLGTENGTLAKLWSHIPTGTDDDMKGEEGATFSAYDLLPAAPEYYTYDGSLTTPPCSEGVTWMVMQQPIEISQEQLAKFQTIFPYNARPLQSLNGRVVKGD